MKSLSGFSLTELLVVITLSSIVIGIGIPSYLHTIANYRMRCAAQQLIQAINQAKEFALNFKTNISLCGSGNGFFCDGKWVEGQIIINKSSNKVVSIFPALPQGISVSWRSNLGHNDQIVFTPLGIPEGQWGSFWLENRNGNMKRLIFNAMGSITS